MKFTSSPFRKCPRCHEKCFAHEPKCHECGLVFDRLNYVSNKTARKKLIKCDRKDIIMTNDWPYDAKKSTALLLCGFLGFTGAHNFYVGRFFKAFLSLIGFLLTAVLLTLSECGLYGTLAYDYVRYITILPGASVLIFWIWDFLSIFFEKYKIPVTIDDNLMQLRETIVEDETKNTKKKK